MRGLTSPGLPVSCPTQAKQLTPAGEGSPWGKGVLVGSCTLIRNSYIISKWWTDSDPALRIPLGPVWESTVTMRGRPLMVCGGGGHRKIRKWIYSWRGLRKIVLPSFLRPPDHQWSSPNSPIKMCTWHLAYQYLRIYIFEMIIPIELGNFSWECRRSLER